MLNKLIFNLGILIRNPTYTKAFKDLKSTEFSSVEDLNQIQLIKIKKFLSFVNENSKFYKKKFKEAAIDVTQITSLSDIQCLPIVSKKELIDFNDDIHTTPKVKFKKTFFSETSGSSGEALTFYKNEEWDSYNRASIARGMSWYNVNPWEYNGYFWGYSFSLIQKVKIQIFDMLLNRFRMFSYSDKELDRFIKKLRKASYLHGYSSMIYETARLVNAKAISLNNLKLIKGTSEKIYDHYHEETKKAFGKKIVSEYGSAESGIIAFECPNGEMHINEETCIVEEVDGEILVTNLLSYSFPIIRYKLGDFIQLSRKKCGCGRNHRILSSVLGRVGKNIIGKDGEVFPSLTLYYIFKTLALEYDIKLNYKAAQYNSGDLNIKIDSQVNDETHNLIMKVSAKYFGQALTVVIQDNEVIHSKDKKLKDFESFIE
ncbi:phenylacetate--CoA ligase family protein [Colwellia sp. 12G3]|uniref:phenylacetate--CoA ligase family protein n=1 Tax=Colwellia sp. 12G3 TaxID=2058299 RepID=UPI000C33191F|nr:phenylacetate--CoA ligase family protein [Colwellia sp. 12G3]PKI17453.1 capsule biosynthesis protein CapK [Colwellia sp. 12G3]